MPLSDLSSYQLQLLLQDRGWTWQKLPGPRTQARTRLPSYTLEGERIWYSENLHVHREYLTALLDAERLHADFAIDEIPHGRAQETYVLLLRGVPLASHPVEPARAQQGRLLMEPDYGDDDGGGAALDLGIIASDIDAVDDRLEQGNEAEDAAVGEVEVAMQPAAAVEPTPLEDGDMEPPGPLEAPGRWGCFMINVNTLVTPRGLRFLRFAFWSLHF